MRVQLLKIFVSLIVALFCVQPLVAQPKIYMSGGPGELKGLPPSTLSNHGAKFIPIIYQNELDPNESMVLNDTLLRSGLLREFPGKYDVGMCVLDWEGKALLALSEQPTDSELYKNVVAQFVKALKVAQAFRPNVKFGYFGINRVDIYKQDDNWKKWNDKFLPIYKQSDILFPQMYHYYPYTIPDFSREKDSLYVTRMTLLMIQYGVALKKPVIPFIWHRYFDDKVSIPDDEFYTHVSFAMLPGRSTKKPDGLLLWTGDEYWISVKDSVISKEQGKMSSEEYRMQNVSRYLKLLKKASNQK